jgi:hypothetical protein
MVWYFPLVNASFTRSATLARPFNLILGQCALSCYLKISVYREILPMMVHPWHITESMASVELLESVE